MSDLIVNGRDQLQSQAIGIGAGAILILISGKLLHDQGLRSDSAASSGAILVIHL
jgi:hypothetical protein